LRGQENKNVSAPFNVIDIDPADNRVLECAVGGNADYIISGDRHLFEVGSFQNIQITKAKEFLIKEGFVTEG
jgi:uncharacterized protein